MIFGPPIATEDVLWVWLNHEHEYKGRGKLDALATAIGLGCQRSASVTVSIILGAAQTSIGDAAHAAGITQTIRVWAECSWVAAVFDTGDLERISTPPPNTLEAWHAYLKTSPTEAADHAILLAKLRRGEDLGPIIVREIGDEMVMSDARHRWFALREYGAEKPGLTAQVLYGR